MVFLSECLPQYASEIRRKFDECVVQKVELLSLCEMALLSTLHDQCRKLNAWPSVKDRQDSFGGKNGRRKGQSVSNPL
jgi:hypothetical protein